MLKVEYARWGQSLEELRHQSVNAEHPRTRERFLALYEMAKGSYPTKLATQINRHYQTVMHWVHEYNEHGPESQVFRHTGGRPPFFKESRTPFAEQ
ncbi:MAG: helix-turn-helix domain-containing protein [Magnetococcales bacterium]|nr:helix-turn-helix domain-containing protein [Magnetococcales bacterium]